MAQCTSLLLAGQVAGRRYLLLVVAGFISLWRTLLARYCAQTIKFETTSTYAARRKAVEFAQVMRLCPTERCTSYMSWLIMDHAISGGAWRRDIHPLGAMSNFIVGLFI